MAAAETCVGGLLPADQSGRTGIDLSDAERERLEATARKYTSPYRDVIRAKIVLYAAEGLENPDPI